MSTTQVAEQWDILVRDCLSLEVCMACCLLHCSHYHKLHLVTHYCKLMRIRSNYLLGLTVTPHFSCLTFHLSSHIAVCMMVCSVTAAVSVMSLLESTVIDMGFMWTAQTNKRCAGLQVNVKEETCLWWYFLDFRCFISFFCVGWNWT